MVFPYQQQQHLQDEQQARDGHEQQGGQSAWELPRDKQQQQQQQKVGKLPPIKTSPAISRAEGVSSNAADVGSSPFTLPPPPQHAAASAEPGAGQSSLDSPSFAARLKAIREQLGPGEEPHLCTAT
jgi:hypothetical protein